MLIYPSCKVPEGMIAANFDTFELDINLNYLAHDMIKSLSQENKHSIAIIEFGDLYGTVSEFGKYVAEELTTRFFTTRRFHILERQLLNHILAEQNLGLSGFIDPSSAAQIGRLIGVEAIVTGTITDLGSSVRINSRLISVETASVFAVSAVSIEKDEKITAMLARNNQSLHINSATGNDGNVPAEPEILLPEIIAEGFRIEVKSCKMIENDKVRIELIITNTNEPDILISLLRNNTVFYDDAGNEYAAVAREIANKQETRPALNHLLINDLPTHMALDFSPVRREAINIRLLNIYFWTSHSSYFTASFRNIPIEH